MSYTGSGHGPPDSHGFYGPLDGDPGGPGPRRRLRGPLTVAAAALVPVALVAWLVYQGTATGSGGSDRATSPAGTRSPATAPAAPHATGRPSPSRTAGGKGGSRPAPKGPLAGKVVVLDAGHNPGNRNHATEINRSVDVGNARKACDTTGTATNAGYAEASFTLDVVRRARTLLKEQGAKVVLTHDGDRPWGPCVDERARAGNRAHADAAVSVHADGAPGGARGFHVILPAPVHQGGADTRKIAGPSRDLGERLVGRFAQHTGTAPSNYIGNGTGLDVRDDLGGLNLSTVPKVFIECANMRDSTDAAHVTSAAWRQKAAEGIAAGIESFLHH